MTESDDQLILQLIYESDREIEATYLTEAIARLDEAFQVSNNVRSGSHFDLKDVRRGSYWIELIAVVANLGEIYDKRACLIEFFDQLEETVPMIVAGTFGTMPLTFSRALAAVAYPVQRVRAKQVRIKLKEGNREIKIDRLLADKIVKTRVVGTSSLTGYIFKVSDDWFFRDQRRHRTMVKIEASKEVLKSFKNGGRYELEGRLSSDNLDAILMVDEAKRKEIR